MCMHGCNGLSLSVFHFSYQTGQTLDPDTAHPELGLSEDCTEATYLERPPPVPDHHDRFDCWEEVLCRQPLDDRCYWELEWRGEQVCIGVLYKGIARKVDSNEPQFGMNQLSCCLDCSVFGFSFWHNDERTDIKAAPSSRIGVFLDHEAGTLFLLHHLWVGRSHPQSPYHIHRASLCRIWVL